jgi:hypothetical protein
MDLATLTQAQSEEVLRGKKLVFLVGAARSGTTWLQVLLSRSPSVATVLETHLFNLFMRSMMVQWNYDRSKGIQIGVTNLMSEEEFRALLRGVSGFVFAKIAQRKPSATVVLEKTPNHVNWWREILDVWPDAHFIHIIRDPRSVVASMRVSSKTWAQQVFPSRISPNCERWVTDVSNGRQISSATDNYQEVAFEKLLSSDGPGVLMRLLAGVGVQSSLDQCRRYVDECRIENLKAGKLDNAPFPMTNRNEASWRIGTTDSWRFELSKREIALIEHRAGPLMSELGYAPTKVSKVMSAFAGMNWTAWEVARAAKWRLRRSLNGTD